MEEPQDSYYEQIDKAIAQLRERFKNPGFMQKPSTPFDKALLDLIEMLFEVQKRNTPPQGDKS